MTQSRTSPAAGRRAAGRWSAVPSAVVGALIAVVTLGVTAHVALHTARGQQLDHAAMLALSGPAGTLQQVNQLLNTISVGTVGLALCVCVLIALARRRWSVAVAVVILVAGANLTTQLLKHEVLTRTDFGFGTLNALPSGHTTVVVSVTLAALLAAPRAWRVPLSLLGSSAATVVGVGTVIARWHRPSDVLAAVAVCVFWAAVAVIVVAVIRAGLAHPPAPKAAGGRSVLASCLAALLGAMAVGVVAVRAGIRPVGTDGSLGLVIGSLSAIGLGCAAAVAWMSHATRRL